VNPRNLPAIRKIISDIEPLIYAKAEPIGDIAVWETPEHVSAEHAAAQTFTPCVVGDTWGGPWQSAWFRFRFSMPQSGDGRPVVARISTSGEAVAFVNQVPFIGLNQYRDEVPLAGLARPGRPVEILVEAGANDAFGRWTGQPRLVLAELAAVNEGVRRLWCDMDFLYQVTQNLAAGTSRTAEINHLLFQAAVAFRFATEDLNAEADRVRRILRPLFKNPAVASAVELVAAGHAHIDVAWKWPLAETTRKCARTFSSAVHYMADYPEFCFSQTQSYLYEVTKKTYPGLYRKICDAVKAGQWEVSTAMYVEPDQNIPSGESLVRQLIFGKRFAREEFGIDVQELVLPDVFGYNAQLPQLLLKAGVPHFTTQKISWNDTNRFPFNSFIWEGLDGSEVLTHFLPGHTYNSNCEPGHLITTEGRHAEKGHSKPVLYQFGYGDGGGGPTPLMLEYLRRAKNFEGVPRCTMGSVASFFRKLEAQSADLPRWVGEFYLELHRGTYTTQGKTKLLNRRCELALREAELFGVLAMATDARYESKVLEEAWKLVLLNQFHDVLPGSSIREVYVLAEKQLADALYEATRLGQASAERLAAQIDTSGDGVPVVLWNALAWPRSGWVQVDVPPGLRRVGVVNAAGEAVPCQKVGRGELLFLATDVPAMGYTVYRLVSGGPAAEAPTLSVTERKLENAFLRVRLNKNGEVTSLYDKVHRREVLDGRGNEFQLFEDRPANWDAWDVEYRTREQALPLPDATSVAVVEDGPARVAVEVVRSFGQSTLRQRIVLGAEAHRVEFHTDVDWHEDRKLLKVAFPVGVRAPEATYEIQFGSLRRPTHMNTSWDQARFEVCAQRWADLSDATYGVSLLNDCKYGYDIHGNVMRLTLLRAPQDPDPQADRGQHQFAYALMPHADGFIEAGTVRAGYEFNVPLRHTTVEPQQGELPNSGSFFWVDAPAVVLDTVKKAEEGDDVILRLYEAHGGRVNARLVTALPVQSAVECDLLERNVGKPMPVNDGNLELTFEPFEVKTLRLTQ